MISRVFKAFAYRDFRLMWFGACTSSIGTLMQTFAQAWLVLDITKSPFMLGLDSFLGSIPIVLFSLVGGVLADRTERQKLLLGSQFVQMACAFILAGLFAAGMREVWPILTLSFIVGTAQSFGGPAYSALIPTLVKTEDLPNAIALNSIQFNVARVLGPTVGGVALTLLGASWCFGLNGVSFIAVIISLLIIHPHFVPAKSRESVLTSMKEGFHFIRNQGAMVALIVLAFMMTLLAFPLIVFLTGFRQRRFSRRTESLYDFSGLFGHRLYLRGPDRGRARQTQAHGAPGLTDDAWPGSVHRRLLALPEFCAELRSHFLCRRFAFGRLHQHHFPGAVDCARQHARPGD